MPVRSASLMALPQYYCTVSQALLVSKRLIRDSVHVIDVYASMMPTEHRSGLLAGRCRGICLR